MLVYYNLKRLRLKKQITLKQMSCYLGYVSPNAYSRKEKGERKFTLEEARKISEVFDLSIEDIFFNK